MKSKIIYKPGTRKILSPRVGDYSQNWGKLVLKNSELEPTKEIKKHIVTLWLQGYSHKDATNILKEMSSSK